MDAERSILAMKQRVDTSFHNTWGGTFSCSTFEIIYYLSYPHRDQSQWECLLEVCDTPLKIKYVPLFRHLLLSGWYHHTLICSHDIGIKNPQKICLPVSILGHQKFQAAHIFDKSRIILTIILTTAFCLSKSQSQKCHKYVTSG